MPIRQRLEGWIEGEDDPSVMDGDLKEKWARLLQWEEGCPFCGHRVATNGFPWRFKHHDIHGTPGCSGMPICAGSRSLFTIDLLGLVVPSHD